MEIDFKDILSQVTSKIDQDYREEIQVSSEDQIRNKWFFRYEPDLSREQNLYHFFQMMELYNKMVRDWEKMHNGYQLVTERVRDKYLMPRIRDFIKDLEKNAKIKVVDPPSRD